MNLMQKKIKSKTASRKYGQKLNLATKKEISELKEVYRKGKLKLDINEVADSVLKDLGNWFQK